jgi:competence protein ComEC
MLLRLCAALLTGALLPPAWGLAVVPVLCLTRPLSRRVLGWVPPVLLAFVTGAWGPRDELPRIDPQTITRIDGWVASRPRHDATSGTWRGIVRIQDITLATGTDSSRTCRATARVVVRARQAMPHYGARIRVEGHFVAPRARRHFHGWDERAYLRARGACGSLFAQRLVALPGHGGNALRREVIEPLRDRLRRAIEDVTSGPARGLLQALLLGIREALGDPLQDAWRALGMAHVLALSGMHVGVVAGGLLVLAGSPRTLRSVLVVLGGVFGYAALGGLGSSVLRASVMVACVTVASLLGRARHPLRSLGTAALLLVAVSPRRLEDLGFQLSCAATLGILVVVTPLAGWALRQRGRSPVRRVGAWAVPVAALGIAAQITTLPWILHHFGLLSWMSPLSNLLLVPPVDIALILGLTAASLSLLLPDLARPLWLVSAGLLHGVAWLSMCVVDHVETRLFLRSDSEIVVLASCTAAAFVIGMLSSGRRRVLVVLLAAACLTATLVLGSRGRFPGWRLDMLDVGQGDAVLLRLRSEAWLIDAGPLRPTDQGEHVVVPHLRREGIDHLRGVVVSHPHADHYGGILAVLRAVPVDTLYVATASLHDPIYTSWSALVPEVPHRGVQAGDRIVLDGATSARVLWPPPTDELSSGANGVSVALWVRSTEAPAVLLMGDLEEDGEEELLQRWGASLRRHRQDFLILKVGHHGSDTSSSTAFLDAVDPEVALISAGKRNRYGHPSAQTLDALRHRACIILRTDRGGDIGLERHADVLWLQRPAARRRVLPASSGAIDVVPAP